MGTTYSFLYIENREFAQGELARILNELSEREKQKGAPFLELVRQLMIREGMAPGPAGGPFGGMERPASPKAALAYREDARWLPLFVESLCDGDIVDSGKLRGLSRQFQTPVFSFALFDSDVLFLSYCDDKEGIVYDYAKPNYEGFDEYDEEGYQSEFPQFLLTLFGAEQEEALRAVWEEENMVFADDRMAKLAELLGLELIYEFSKDIPGFQRIVGE